MEVIMSKFKVGDKVRIKSIYFSFYYYPDVTFVVTQSYFDKSSFTGEGNYYYTLDDNLLNIPEQCLLLVEENIESTQSSKNNGGKTDYYQLPEWVKDADDFTEWRGMDFFQGNILKSVWCFNTQRHSGTNEERELNKIIHYAQKRLNKIKKERVNGK